MSDSSKNIELDIERQQIGATYAKALVGAYGIERAESVVEELESFVVDVLDRISGVEDVLSSLRIDADQKANFLQQAFQGKASDDFLTFLLVLNRHERLDCIRHVAHASRDLIDQHQGRVKARLVTAEPLDGDLFERIRGILNERLKADVKLESIVDPSLIGGMVVRVGDRVFDASIANTLRRLRHDAVNKTVQQLRNATDQFVQEV